MTVKAIWAQSVTGVIGLRNTLPWSVPEDLAYFKKNTLGSTVVMGRKTWDSLPASYRPLKGRRNLVLTRDESWESEGAVPVHSVADAVKEAGKTEHGVDGDLWVIGGAEVYSLFLPYVSGVLMTVVYNDVAGDAYAPPLPDVFSCVSSSERLTSRSGLLYEFTVLKRQGSAANVSDGDGKKSVQEADSIVSSDVKKLSDPAVRKALFTEVRAEAHAARAERQKVKKTAAAAEQTSSSHIETSPGGVGFVRPASRKVIDGEPESASRAARRSWLKR